MLAAVKGYYNGSHIVINENISLNAGHCPDLSSPEAGKAAPFLSKRIIREPYGKRISRKIPTFG